MASDRRGYATVDERGEENEYALYSPNEESEKRLGNGGGGGGGGGVDDEKVVVDSGGEKEGVGIGARTDSSNILDDMEKFQREIDELRVRFKQAG